MIYVDLKGRLGNQMFIYACAYALSKQNNDEPITFVGEKYGNSLFNYNIRNVSEDRIDLKYTTFQRILMKYYSMKADKLNRTELLDFEKKAKKLYVKNGLFLCQNGYMKFNRKECNRTNVYLNGYFQSEKYFYSVKLDLKDIFVPIKNLQRSYQILYEQICKDQKAVCVDFRIGDYLNNPLHEVCGLEYYKNAMEYLENKLNHPNFYLFSTDIDYIKKITSNWKYKIILENGTGADYEKLRIMSACKHFILTNSTFDWWAQYLSSEKEKITIAPARWFADECPCDIYMRDWVLMDGGRK